MLKFNVVLESGYVMDIVIQDKDIGRLIGVLEDSKSVKRYYVTDILTVDQEKAFYGPNSNTTKKWKGPKLFELYDKFTKEHQKEILDAITE